MMPLPLYAGFLLASLLLTLTPGPNVALIVATSLAEGPRTALRVVAGTTAAMAAQLALVGLGLAALMGAMEGLLTPLRWAGVIWLIWLALRQWQAPAPLAGAPPARDAFWRGAAVAALNPKSLLFLAAFLPQFMVAEAPLRPQIALLGTSFLLVALLVDSGWALLAGQARSWLTHALARRLGALTLLGAALLLALTRF